MQWRYYPKQQSQSPPSLSQYACGHLHLSPLIMWELRYFDNEGNKIAFNFHLDELDLNNWLVLTHLKGNVNFVPRLNLKLAYTYVLYQF